MRCLFRSEGIGTPHARYRVWGPLPSNGGQDARDTQGRDGLATWAVLLTLAFLLPAFGAGPNLPMPTQYVDDLAHVINPEHAHRLLGLLQELEHKTGAQYIILTIDTTGGRPIEQFTRALLDRWQLGQKGKDNGVLFTLALKDRAYRFDIGSGLEGVITNAIADQIGRDVLVPYLRNGQYSQGIYEANLRILQKLADYYRYSITAPAPRPSPPRSPAVTSPRSPASSLPRSPAPPSRAPMLPPSLPRPHTTVHHVPGPIGHTQGPSSLICPAFGFLVLLSFLALVFGTLRGGPGRRIRRDDGSFWPWLFGPSLFNGFGGYGGHGDSGALGGGPFGGGFGAFGGGMSGGFGSFGDAGSSSSFGSFGGGGGGSFSGGGASGHW